MFAFYLPSVYNGCMFDNARFEDIDKWASKRVNEIFSDPSRHTFEPFSRQDLRDGWATRWRGRKGARLVRLPNGSRRCIHCGTAKHGHAKETERL